MTGPRTATASEYSAAGRAVRCPHCGGRKFAAGRAPLDGGAPAALDNRTPDVSILVCAECGRIEWFARPPDRAEVRVR
ncbi:MAG TPA: hypothetical protein VNI78_12780 [Vicinamibacterales bacterium]|nr:hypothetical protein [Vicinamibacterales bacterium]